MKVLLDTHIMLWAFNNDVQLSSTARRLINDTDNEKYYSIASLWEVEIKHLLRPDKITTDSKTLFAYCRQTSIRMLPIKEQHIFALGSLKRKDGAPPNKDPFYRIMLCQAMADNMFLLTHDKLLADYEQSSVILV